MGIKAFGFRQRAFWLRLSACAAVFLGAHSALASCTITRVSSWTYASNGLMTSETVQPTQTVGSLTPTSCAGIRAATATTTTSYAYDAYGNTISESVSGSDSANSQAGVAARTTTTIYDSQGEFVATVTNAFGQSESWTYDPGFGVPITHTGPDGLTTTWSYDALGRKSIEWLADGTVISWQYAYPKNSASKIFYVFKAQEYYSSATGYIQTTPSEVTYYDELGRPTIKYVQAYQTSNGTTSLTWASETTTYDAMGRIATADTIPVFGTNPTTYTYDALGRQKTVSMPGAPSTLLEQYSYNGLTSAKEVFSAYNSPTTNTGETTTTTKNSQGLPVSVTNTEGYTTTYSYDAIGDLLSITDPENNLTSYTYDNEGRQLTMADPNRGNWTYGYDALGELLTETSPNEVAAGHTTTLQYDALGRLVQRSQPDQVDRFTYYNGPLSGCPAYQGTASACVGKLSSDASYTNTGTLISQKTITYDDVGRPAVTTIQPTVTAPGYSFRTAYNQSQVDTVTYPSGYQVKYGYNGIGVMSAFTCTANCTAGAGTALWTLNTTNAADQVLTETYGNGISVANTYGAYVNGTDTANGNLLTATQAGLSATPTTVGNFTYTYDDLGDLNARQDINLNLNESFTYDPLYRLTGDSLTGAYTSDTTVTYDRLGNIASKSNVGNYLYGGRPDTIISISCSTGEACANIYNVNSAYYYDADGNITGGNGYAATWTTFDMPLTVANGTTSFAYTYDADHQRVTQTQSSSGTLVSATDYINDVASGQHSELASNGVWTDYLTVGKELLGIHIAQPALSTTGPCGTTSATTCNRFFIHDHLGSVAVVTDDSGNVLERDVYDPWGKRRNTNGSPDLHNTVTSATTRGFAGQEMVQNGAGFELVNMNARLYDPTIGRFLSPDPQLPKAGMQADLINPYTYCDNNPLSITDPTGQSWLSILGIIVAIIIAIAVPYVASFVALDAGLGITAGTTAASVVNAAIVGSIAGAADGAIASGGNLTATLEGLGIGAATGAAFEGIGGFTNSGATSFRATLVHGAISKAANFAPAFLEQVAGDGLVGGLSSVAEGGNFESGFLAAGFSNVVGGSLLNNGGHLDAYNVAAEAVTGGVGSVIGGGSFENGAITGSFRYLFSQEAQAVANGQNPLQQIGQGLDHLGGDIRYAYDGLVGINANPLNQNPIGQSPEDQALYAGVQQAQAQTTPGSQLGQQAIEPEQDAGLKGLFTGAWMWYQLLSGQPWQYHAPTLEDIPCSVTEPKSGSELCGLE